ncbi:MAG TPA: four helix bundle protein [Candidatus Desulfofervidus auxilii]|uniref:Four helix bundle protein n=1 Tax=Desulfofervidus auxilii TaxID=1621989 RepID=A0A7C2AKC2_DESA2|nr:four helix bundle protein [Candidatus Desulfofervidus auxilii]
MERSRFENLEVWQLAMKLVRNIYLISKSFPREEIYGITAQLRRAAISIPLNIAEGSGRGYDKVFLQFLFQARGSLMEVKTLILICKEIAILPQEKVKNLIKEIDTLHRKLNSLITYLQQSITDYRPQTTNY